MNATTVQFNALDSIQLELLASEVMTLVKRVHPNAMAKVGGLNGHRDCICICDGRTKLSKVDHWSNDYPSMMRLRLEAELWADAANRLFKGTAN